MFVCKEELFVKNIEINDLEEMEEVAEIAVNRCRKRLMNLQNKVERRKGMLEKVKDTLIKLEHAIISEDCENNMQILEMRKSGLGESISAIKSCQRNMDEKMQGLLLGLDRHGVRICHMNEKLLDEKRRIRKMEQELKIM